MRTRAKGITLGRMTLMAAIAPRSRGRRAIHRNRKMGAFRRTMTAVPDAATRARSLMQQLERAGMIVGAVMTGLELAREIRSAASTGGRSEDHIPRDSDLQSASRAPARRQGSSARSRNSGAGNRSTSKSASSARAKRRQNGASAATTRSRRVATKRSVSARPAKKAGA
jgi:hypothetical protein